jgi:hypothetical protein
MPIGESGMMRLQGPSGEPRVIDVGGMIRQASTRVSVDHLVKNGKRYIKLLSPARIDELINRAVQTILDKHRLATAVRRPAPAGQIQAESLAEFEELLHQYQQTADATSAVECARRTLEQELQETRLELAPKPAWPEDRPSEGTGSPAAGGFELFVRELDEQLVRMFKVRTLILERSESPGAAAELKRVEEVLRPLLSKLVQVERERFAPSVGPGREVAMLHRRVEKLLAHIATMEAALKTLSTAKTFSNQQVQNLLRELGLAQEDKNFEKKREMLKIVLDTNQGIRLKARELAARGITLDSPEEKAVFTEATESLSGVFSRSSV